MKSSPTADSWVFTITGEVPSLKNERIHVVDGDRHFTRPNNEVQRFVQSAKTQLRRQIETNYPSFKVINMPVFVYMEIGVYTLNDLPLKDNDNCYTTLQECLFTRNTEEGPVLIDDRLVIHPDHPWKFVRNRDLTYSTIYVSIYDKEKSRLIGEYIKQIYGFANIDDHVARRNSRVDFDDAGNTVNDCF